VLKQHNLSRGPQYLNLAQPRLRFDSDWPTYLRATGELHKPERIYNSANSISLTND
jgi:hypothetical protein